jgi:hypothetical protein
MLHCLIFHTCWEPTFSTGFRSALLAHEFSCSHNTRPLRPHESPKNSRKQSNIDLRGCRYLLHSLSHLFGLAITSIIVITSRIVIMITSIITSSSSINNLWEHPKDCKEWTPTQVCQDFELVWNKSNCVEFWKTLVQIERCFEEILNMTLPSQSEKCCIIVK